MDTPPAFAPKSFARVSLARRLLFGAALWSILILVGGGLALSAVYRTQTLELLDEELDNTLQTLVRAVAVDTSGNLTAQPSALPPDPRYQTPLSGRYWLIIARDQEGRYEGNEVRPASMWDGAPPWPEARFAELASNPGIVHHHSLRGPADEPIRAAAQALLIPERAEPIFVMAAFDRRGADASAQRLTLLMLIAMTLLVAGVLPAMWFGLRVALRPLARVEADIADVRQGRKSQLDGDYPTEVRELTSELNMLLDHNKEVVERARTHVGNLAHALKTPIAVLQNEARGETALDDVVKRQTASMHANVQHYLKRAQAAARAGTLGARTDIAPPIEGLARLMNKLFQDKGIRVTARLAPDSVVRGETQDIEEMLGNLMDNACKWAQSEVCVSAMREGEMIVIHVDDDGPGLAPEERAAALKRGVRLDETAPGTGLGLSIVTELAEMHSGQFDLSHAPELGGLRATLRVPAA